jgi:hypothetical protein
MINSMLCTITESEYPKTMKNKYSGRLDSWKGQEMFLFSKKTSRQPTQPPTQWVQGVKQLGMMLTTHLHLVLRVRKKWRNTSSPSVFLHGMHRDNFTFSLLGPILIYLSMN